MKNNSRLQFPIIILVVVICGLSITFVNRTFVSEKSLAAMEVAREQSDRFAEGYLEVNAEVIRVDATVRFGPQLSGRICEGQLR